MLFAFQTMFAGVIAELPEVVSGDEILSWQCHLLLNHVAEAAVPNVSVVPMMGNACGLS